MQETFLIGIVAAPGLAFALLSVLWLLGAALRERTIVRLTIAVFGLAAVGCAGLFWTMWTGGLESVRLEAGSWFTIGHYSFPLILLADRVSFPMIALTVLLAGLIGAFSARYLHRDPGFTRFFILLHLFAFGALLAFSAGSFDLLVGGWELVGLTSVLLVAFFQERKEPVRSAIRVFVMYRMTDIGLLAGVAFLHHFAGTARYEALGAAQLTGVAAALTGLLFVVAACGKSAQIPFSGWLPQAMEGPTPSSAIFYGAISVHLGAYLLLRVTPLLGGTPVPYVLVAIGLLTAVHGTMVGRACADAKTSLAYASLAQLGIIFAEIGLGFRWLALAHMTGHSVVRTLQFLRAPSLLHEYHQIHAAAGGELDRTGEHYEALLPHWLRSHLYRAAIFRGYHDYLLDRFVVGPVVRLSGWLCAVERALVGWETPQARAARARAARLTTAARESVDA